MRNYFEKKNNLEKIENVDTFNLHSYPQWVGGGI